MPGSSNLAIELEEICLQPECFGAWLMGLYLPPRTPGLEATQIVHPVLQQGACLPYQQRNEYQRMTRVPLLLILAFR